MSAPVAASHVITWADGWGTWHAQVPDGDDAHERAWEAIVSELEQREGPWFAPSRMQVHYVGQVGDDIVYRETWPALDGVPAL